MDLDTLKKSRAFLDLNEADREAFLSSYQPAEKPSSGARSASSLPQERVGIPPTSHPFGKYGHLIEKAAATEGVDPALLHAQMQVESGGNPKAVSKAGAQGLMQLMPGTAAEVGVTDPFNPEQNIAGAARYFRKLLDYFRGNETKAIAAYNAGPGNVDKALVRRGGKWIEALPTETQQYLTKVAKLRDKLGRAPMARDIPEGERPFNIAQAIPTPLPLTTSILGIPKEGPLALDLGIQAPQEREYANALVEGKIPFPRDQFAKGGNIPSDDLEALSAHDPFVEESTTFPTAGKVFPGGESSVTSPATIPGLSPEAAREAIRQWPSQNAPENLYELLTSDRPAPQGQVLEIPRRSPSNFLRESLLGGEEIAGPPHPQLPPTRSRIGKALEDVVSTAPQFVGDVIAGRWPAEPRGYKFFTDAPGRISDPDLPLEERITGALSLLPTLGMPGKVVSPLSGRTAPSPITQRGESAEFTQKLRSPLTQEIAPPEPTQKLRPRFTEESSSRTPTQELPPREVRPSTPKATSELSLEELRPSTSKITQEFSEKETLPSYKKGTVKLEPKNESGLSSRKTQPLQDRPPISSSPRETQPLPVHLEEKGVAKATAKLKTPIPKVAKAPKAPIEPKVEELKTQEAITKLREGMAKLSPEKAPAKKAETTPPQTGSIPQPKKINPRKVADGKFVSPKKAGKPGVVESQPKTLTPSEQVFQYVGDMRNLKGARAQYVEEGGKKGLKIIEAPENKDYVGKFNPGPVSEKYWQPIQPAEKSAPSQFKVEPQASGSVSLVTIEKDITAKSKQLAMLEQELRLAGSNWQEANPLKAKIKKMKLELDTLRAQRRQFGM